MTVYMTMVPVVLAAANACITQPGKKADPYGDFVREAGKADTYNRCSELVKAIRDSNLANEQKISLLGEVLNRARGIKKDNEGQWRCGLMGVAETVGEALAHLVERRGLKKGEVSLTRAFSATQQAINVALSGSAYHGLKEDGINTLLKLAEYMHRAGVDRKMLDNVFENAVGTACDLRNYREPGIDPRVLLNRIAGVMQNMGLQKEAGGIIGKSAEEYCRTR